ncbi:S-adenosyl-L-methionine-dependent methyltransferase [Dichotomocladium elegans]|nr:S-adenosyl-L-methionine-dependent methyltransferase [Dichotomocladium elegans]
MTTVRDNAPASPTDPIPGHIQTNQSTSAHRYEDGRHFHADKNITYILPDDIQEDDRLHLQHWAVQLAFGSNFDAPVQEALEDGIKVLDSACGPGTWVLEMAKAFPNSKFCGTDLSSRFPDQIKPKNSEFYVHNIVEDPPFEKDSFGYIHQQAVTVGIKIVDWPKVLENHKLILKPGGWIELTEFSYTEAHNSGPITKAGNDISFKMLAAAGLDPDLGSHLTTLLADAGFTNIQARSVDIPVNHGGKLGELFWENTKEAFKSTKSVYAKFRPEFQEPGVYEKFIEDMGEECKTYKSTVRWTRAIAQKPSTD